MNVSKAVENIGKKLEDILAKNEDALSWDTEVEIKKSIVKNCKLEKIFNDINKLQNMYTYEMFGDNYKIPNDKKIQMVQTWIKKLDELANIDVGINPKEIK